MGKRFDLTGGVALVSRGCSLLKTPVKIAEQLMDFQDQEGKRQGPKFGVVTMCVGVDIGQLVPFKIYQSASLNLNE